VDHGATLQSQHSRKRLKPGPAVTTISSLAVIPEGRNVHKIACAPYRVSIGRLDAAGGYGDLGPPIDGVLFPGWTHIVAE
jgi:hypothetical protein